MAKGDQVKALADFIASFGLSESEAASVVSGALRRLGWTSRLTQSQPEGTIAIKLPAAELLQREQNPLLAVSTHSDAPPKSSRVQQLFGNLPDELKTKTYTKSDLPKEWLDDPEVIRAANRILGTYRRRKGQELEADAAEKVRMARRIIRAHERRRSSTLG